MVSLSAAVVEAVAIVLSSVAGTLAYNGLMGLSGSDLEPSIGVGVLSGAGYIAAVQGASLYSLAVLLQPTRHLRTIAAFCGGVLLTVTGLLFLLKVGASFSRCALSTFAVSMLVSCVVARLGVALVIKRLIAANSITGRPAYILGDKVELDALTASHLLQHFGLTEVGRRTLDDGRRATGLGIEDALQDARLVRAKEIVVAAKLDSLDRLTRIEHPLRVSPLPVKLLPNHVFRSVIERHSSVFAAPLHLVELQRAPLSLTEQFTKRLLDMCGASLALLMLLPLFIVAASAVWLDGGRPVIFRQKRNGFDQRPFTILKFRTMTVLEDGDIVVQARRRDHRVTRVGSFLRRTSIDELPQLLNVLRGDMSLVGPRPHALVHDDVYKKVISSYCMRHHLKPGITGWAQVNGLRGETARTEDMERRVEYDIWYVNNCSLALDLQILWKTCFKVLEQKAY